MKKWFAIGIIVVQFVVIALLAYRINIEETNKFFRHSSVQVEEYPYGMFTNTWEEWQYLNEHRRIALVQDNGAPLWFDHGALLYTIPDMETLYQMVDRGL